MLIENDTVFLLFLPLFELYSIYTTETATEVRSGKTFGLCRYTPLSI